MRILFLSHRFYPEIGGIEVNSEILATHFQSIGADVRLVTWTKENGKKEFPFTVIRNPNLAVLIRLHHWADVVYENNPCLRLAWPSILFKRPKVVALRTWIARLDGKIGWQDRLKRRWLQHAAAVIAVSEAVRKQCWENAIVIGNPYRAELFKKLHDTTKNVDFAFLGRLVSDKGATLAINAFYQFLKMQEQGGEISASCKLTIIGEGPEKRNLEQLTQTLSICNRVKFTGALKGDKLVKCLNNHKYLLVPSIWEEPFGNVALEGMACGCIPIVSDGGGLPDAVGKAGITFKRGSVDDFVDAIREVYLNVQMQEQLVINAEEHLLAHHPVEVSKAYFNVIMGAKSSSVI